jgi:hypothetical protein
MSLKFRVSTIYGLSHGSFERIYYQSITSYLHSIFMGRTLSGIFAIKSSLIHYLSSITSAMCLILGWNSSDASCLSSGRYVSSRFSGCYFSSYREPMASWTRLREGTCNRAPVTQRNRVTRGSLISRVSRWVSAEQRPEKA